MVIRSSADLSQGAETVSEGDSAGDAQEPAFIMGGGSMGGGMPGGADALRRRRAGRRPGPGRHVRMEQAVFKQGEPIIQMRGIRKSYYLGRPNELEILHGIDLTVTGGGVPGHCGGVRLAANPPS